MRGAASVAVVAVAAAGLGGCAVPARGTMPARGGEARSAERTVVLDLRWSRFSPSEIEVAVGTTVRFEVRNRDPIAHELIVGDASVQDRHERGTEAQHGDRPGEVSVPPRSTAVTTYMFSRPGSVAFGCHLPGHWDYGMRGSVLVR